MDIVTLSSAVASALLHALPHLTTSAGDGAAKAIGGKLGEQAFKLAEKIWDHLKPKVEASPAAVVAVADAAAEPRDEDNLAALRKEIKKILKSDSALTEVLSKLLEEDEKARGHHYFAQAGDGGVAAGKIHGDVHITNTFGSKK